MILTAGLPAPLFTLESAPGQQVTLYSLLNSNLVLMFYPADFSPGSIKQVDLFNQFLPQITASQNTHLVGISVDGVWSHSAFSAQQKLNFTLLADFQPKGAVSQAYGVFREAEGVTQQALFLLDYNGTIRWSFASPVDVPLGTDGLAAALVALEKTQSDTTNLSVPITAADHTTGGKPGTLFNVVEYGDFQAPACAAIRAGIAEMQKEFGPEDTCFAYRHFPLTDVHPEAEAAAEVSEFAAAHGKFWEMHDLLLANQDSLGAELYAKLATQLSLDPVALAKALADKTYAAHVQSDIAGALSSGVNALPCFFINGTWYDGRMSGDGLIEVLNGILAPG